MFFSFVTFFERLSTLCFNFVWIYYAKNVSLSVGYYAIHERLFSLSFNIPVYDGVSKLVTSV